MAVKLSGLDFAYGSRPVLRQVDLSIAKGRFTVLLGTNGCGKTTLLKCIAGLLKPRRGRVEVMGHDLTALPVGKRARLVGYLPQAHRPVFPFSVRDVVLTGRAGQVNLAPKARDLALAEAALRRVGMESLASRPFTDLSGGEQQMIMLARVLAQGPSLILLDEPTSHLDLPNQARVLSLARELVRDGLTVTAVLHDPNQAFLYGDEFVFLRRGQVLPLAPGQKPWDAEVIKSVYGVELESAPFGERALLLPRLRPPCEGS